MTPKTLILGLVIANIFVVATGAIEYKGFYDRTRGVLAGLESEIGRKVSVPAIADATVIAADTSDVWVAGTDDLGRPVLSRLGRKEAGMPWRASDGPGSGSR